MDELEQYSRRNCFILHGFAENEYPDHQEQYEQSEKAMTNKLATHLKTDIDIKAIEVDIAPLFPLTF